VRYAGDTLSELFERKWGASGIEERLAEQEARERILEVRAGGKRRRGQQGGWGDEAESRPRLVLRLGCSRLPSSSSAASATSRVAGCGAGSWEEDDDMR
jgi:hypothetical protein